MALTTHSVAHSDVGTARERNEDACFTDDALGLYIVADGVGGHPAGDIASRLAIETAASLVEAQAQATDEGEATAVPPVALAERAVQAACAEVHRRATEDPELRGMATTMTLLLFEGSRACMAHVGDSRLYKVRGGRTHQLSDDHTVAAELARAGVIEKSAIEHHPFAHSLSRSLGTQPSVVVDTLEIAVASGDTFVLASDGVDPAAADREFAQIAGDEDLDAAPQRIVERAKQRGSSDNLTAIVVRCTGGTSPDAMVFDVLREVPAFAGISAAGLWHLCEAGRIRHVDPEEVVLTPDEPCQQLLAVLDGRLRWRGGPTLEPGSVLGTTSLFGPRTPPHILVAEVPTRLFVLSADAFRGLARRRRALGLALLTAVGAALTRTLEARGAPTPEDAIASF